VPFGFSGASGPNELAAKCSEYAVGRSNPLASPPLVTCGIPEYHEAMSYCILRTAKLKTSANIAASLSHTFRDRPTDNADPERKALNEASDQRTAAEVLSGITARWPDKRRRDAVLCIEYLIATSPVYFKDGESGAAYFEAARQWLIDQHGAENVVFSAIHRDELTPHMVAYVVPIRDGRLNAKHWLGGKAKLSAMQTDFAKTVAQPFGLNRGIEGSTARHTTVRQFYADVNVTAATYAKAYTEKVREAQADNQRLRADLDEWASAYDDGLTADQADRLLELANQMRAENQLAARQKVSGQASTKPQGQNDGQMMDM
jgi:hypothetical protein